MKSLSLISALVCSVFGLCLSSCESEKATLFFLAEADGTEAGAAMTIMFKGKPYERTPIFALNQFEKFDSFMNPSDGSYGVSLKADSKYNSRLFSATAARQGKFVIPVMNGLAFEPTIITQPVSDGVMIIWNGLNGYDLRLLSHSLDPVDAEKEEKRYLDENPRQRLKFNAASNQQRDISGRVIEELPFMSESAAAE